MKTPEERLSRGNGSFINCTDYDDAIIAMKQYAIEYHESEVNKLKQADVSGSLHYANEPICNKNGTGAYCGKCGDITKCNDH